jgi:predicted nuclease of predicted toxin-antitoxin system
MLRLLLDQGVPADAAIRFRQLGYESSHVSEFGMQRAEERSHPLFAIKHDWIVVTLDADFHSLVAVRSLSGPSVIRLRREGCRAEAIVSSLIGVLTSYRSELASGCLISVKEHRITCHRLPIGADL